MSGLPGTWLGRLRWWLAFHGDSLLVGRSSCVLRNIVKLHRDDSPSGNPQAGATNRWGLEPIVLVQDPRLLEEEIAAVIGVTGEAAGAIEATDDSMISQDDSNERGLASPEELIPCVRDTVGLMDTHAPQ